MNGLGCVGLVLVGIGLVWALFAGSPRSDNDQYQR